MIKHIFISAVSHHIVSVELVLMEIILCSVQNTAGLRTCD